MAQYKRKNIADNAIGADKIALENNKFLRADNFAKDGYVDILKVKEDDTVEIPVLVQAVSDLEAADAATLASANLYTDNAIAAIPPVDLSAYATTEYVDTNFALLSDLSNYATLSEVSDFDAAVLAEAKDYTDLQIAAIPSVDLSAYETIVNVDSKDAATLASANLYTDNAIAAIPGVDLSGIQSDIDDLEVLTASIQSDVDDLEVLVAANVSDIDALELEMPLKETIVNVDSKDAATLASANLYTDNAIAAIPPVDLSAYATTEYVDTNFALLSDLSNYATLSEVSDFDTAVLAEAKDYTDQQIAAIPPVDLSAYETIVNVDSKDAATLASANLYTDEKIAIEDARIDDLEARLANVQKHTGDFNASPFKIHLVSGVSVINMPAPVLNHTVTIKKTGSDLATLLPHGSELIEGGANYLLTSTRQSATLVSDGTDWFII
jgi:hypothetical protein